MTRETRNRVFVVLNFADRHLEEAVNILYLWTFEKKNLYVGRIHVAPIFSFINIVTFISAKKIMWMELNIYWKLLKEMI